MDNDHLNPVEDPKLGLPADAEARVIKVCLSCSSAPSVGLTILSIASCEQEARKEGIFAGLTGGLASGKRMFVLV